MNDSLQEQVVALRRELAELRQAFETERTMWRNAQIAPESGGGSVTFGRDSVYIRLNALTPSSAQTP